MPRLLKYFLYLGVFLFSFILFVYWMLPVDAFKGEVIALLEKRLGGSYQVRIEELDTYRITGVRLKELRIQQGGEGKPETLCHFDQLKARVGLFSLLFGNLEVRFDARMSKARFSGTVQKKEEGFLIESVFRNVDLGGIPYFPLTTGLHFVSSIDGRMALHYDAKQPLRTEGDMDVQIKQLRLKKSTVPLGEMGTFPLPDLELAEADSGIQAKIRGGSMRVETLKLKAADLTLDLKGRVFLAPQFSRYRINLQGDFQFSPKLWEILDPLLPEPWASELKKQKGQGTTYPLSIAGQLSTPQIFSGAIRIYPFKPF